MMMSTQHYIIYYHKAYQVMGFTDYQDAIYEVEDPDLRKLHYGSINSRFAYYAMEADIHDAISRQLMAEATTSRLEIAVRADPDCRIVREEVHQANRLLTTVDVFYTKQEAMLFIEQDPRENLYMQKELDGKFHIYELPAWMEMNDD